MNLIVDENIALAKDAFSGFGKLKLVNGRFITTEIVRDAEILIVRSITNVDEKLLRKSKVKFVGTATIGTEHVDLDYLEKQRIKFSDAKGCNADSVAEYVITSLLKIANEMKISIKDKTIGVVGIGNIGSRVVRLAESLGMKVLKNDPPLERKGIGKNYLPLKEILNTDIITLHVPLSYKGIDKTFHLLNANNLKMIKENTVIINTSRGAVIDNSALLKEAVKKNFNLILDVWENEPTINNDLLKKTKIATPHIAGYSLEGKVNGTKMIYDSLCKFLNRENTWQPKLPSVEHQVLRLSEDRLDEERLYKLLSSVYNPEEDDSRLREISNYKLDEQAEYFDKLRKNYLVRREFCNYTVQISEKDKHLKLFLESLRFKVKRD